jgi:REP element-mobilizing transposase RayT
MGYGHWLPNDPRGSGSTEICKADFSELGDFHFGRKDDQPTRDELRDFFREAEPLLDHDIVWFDERLRRTIACAFAEVIRQHGYTVWACAILRNHAHLVIPTNKFRSEAIWDQFARASATSLRSSAPIKPNHLIWSHRPYKVFLKTRRAVRTRIGYVEPNPEKEGLPRQSWPFVAECPWH